MSALGHFVIGFLIGYVFAVATVLVIQVTRVAVQRRRQRRWDAARHAMMCGAFNPPMPGGVTYINQRRRPAGAPPYL